MNFTRAASKCAKHMWPSWIPRYSSLSQIMNKQCRNINTGIQSPRFGNVGGKMKGYDLPTLEAFNGAWHQAKSKNYLAFLQATGASENTTRFLVTHKSWVIYDIDGDKLTCVFGFKGSTFAGSYSSLLGKPYQYIYFNGLPMKAIYYQDGNIMKEQHICENTPDFMIEVERELISKNKMVARSRYKGIEASKVLTRGFPPKEYFHI